MIIISYPRPFRRPPPESFLFSASTLNKIVQCFVSVDADNSLISSEGRSKWRVGLQPMVTIPPSLWKTSLPKPKFIN